MSESTLQDLINQQVHFNDVYGREVAMSLATFQSYQESIITSACVWSFMIGGGAFTLISLLIMRPTVTPVFVINVFNLVTMIIQAGLLLAYLTGPFANVAVSVTFAFPLAVRQSDVANSVALSVLKVIQIVGVELSMILQTRIVFVAQPSLQKLATLVCSLLGLVTIICWTGLLIVRSIYIVRMEFFPYSWLATVSIILFGASVCVSCVIFNLKLLFAILQRRQLGIKQFSPLHIILIMGTQTMLVPMAISIAAIAVGYNHEEIASLSVFFVIISLPLSSIWARSRSTLNTSYPTSSSTASSGFGTFTNGFVSFFGVKRRNQKRASTQNHYHTSTSSQTAWTNEKNSGFINEHDLNRAHICQVGGKDRDIKGYLDGESDIVSLDSVSVSSPTSNNNQSSTINTCAGQESITVGQKFQVIEEEPTGKEGPNDSSNMMNIFEFAANNPDFDK